MSDRYSRVQLLLSQHRNEMAERDLRMMLADDPHDAFAHSLLAFSMLNDQTRLNEATQEAQTAVGLEPDESFCHYALAAVFVERNRYGEAETAIQESLRLDPYDADAFALLAQTYLPRQRFQESLDACEKGLAIDPEHLNCNNLRSISLERLGRSDEAILASSESLKRDPDEPMSHAAHGFTLLNAGRHKEAQLAFREALRLDPNNEMARVGMINALNSRSFVFRLAHKYFVFMSRLNEKAAMLLVFGAWIFVQILDRVIVPAMPMLAPLVYPLIILYVVFVVLTWIANPLFNTFLRFHPFGQHLLNRKQTWASNLLAPTLLLSIVGFVSGMIIGDVTLALLAAGYWLGLAIPISSAFAMETKQNELLIGGGAIVIALLPIYGIIRTLMTGDADVLYRSFQNFGWGLLAIQIASNVLASRVERR